MTPEIPSSPALILIVEDEAIIAADLEQTLQRLGFATMGPAASAAEALVLARANRPQIALLDIRLQGPTDGIALAEVMREELGVPVVFLTAHADQATLDRAQVTEPFGYLLKPFDERMLQITIGMAIYRHGMEAERKRLTAELEHALAEVKTLSGLLSTCSFCRKIEDATGEWIPIETYISKRSEAIFSHTYCPTCLRREFPDVAEAVLKKVQKKSGN